MATVITTQQSAFLRSLGFTATFPNDKDPGCNIYTLKIPSHPLLKGLFLDVDCDFAMDYSKLIRTGLIAKSFSVF